MIGQNRIGQNRIGQNRIGRGIQWVGLALVGLALGMALLVSRAIAAPAPVDNAVASVTVHLGTAEGGLRFEPSQLSFTAGQRYRLVLDNPSPEKHYFTAKDFADGIWSQKVQAAGVEVKGAIHELELKPGATADWVFVPERPGTYELHCAIPGHAAAGMVGQIEVVAP